MASTLLGSETTELSHLSDNENFLLSDKRPSSFSVNRLPCFFFIYSQHSSAQLRSYSWIGTFLGHSLPQNIMGGVALAW